MHVPSISVIYILHCMLQLLKIHFWIHLIKQIQSVGCCCFVIFLLSSLLELPVSPSLKLSVHRIQKLLIIFVVAEHSKCFSLLFSMKQCAVKGSLKSVFTELLLGKQLAGVTGQERPAELLKHCHTNVHTCKNGVKCCSCWAHRPGSTHCAFTLLVFGQARVLILEAMLKVCLWLQIAVKTQRTVVNPWADFRAGRGSDSVTEGQAEEWLYFLTTRKEIFPFYSCLESSFFAFFSG